LNLIVVAPPDEEPVSLEEAKAHLRVDHSADDDLITAMIVAAREVCEQEAGRAFITQTWQLSLERFPGSECPIEIPKPPLIGIESVTYIDGEGDDQVLDPSAYYADTADDPGRLLPAFETSWPDAREFPNSVRIEFEAGYGAAAAVPARAKQAIKLLVSHWYEHREAVLTGTISKEIEFSLQMLLRQLWHGRTR
jgi:uncharacterized phiE125 gp8 family phage protein